MLTGSLLISPSPSENSSRWCWLGGAAIWDLLRSHQGIPRCDFFFFQAGPPRKALPGVPTKFTLQILYGFLPQHHLNNYIWHICINEFPAYEAHRVNYPDSQREWHGDLPPQCAKSAQRAYNDANTGGRWTPRRCSGSSSAFPLVWQV